MILHDQSCDLVDEAAQLCLFSFIFGAIDLLV